jgi:hypothetical protein
MMEKLAEPGEPVTISTITLKVVVYTPAERADTLPLFLLHPYNYSADLIPYLKGPKREIFGFGIFAQIRPIWIG